MNYWILAPAALLVALPNIGGAGVSPAIGSAALRGGVQDGGRGARPTQVAQAETLASPADAYLPGAAEHSTAALLGSAKYALSRLGETEDEDERRTYYAMAIAALTGLYQLHGCQWAKEPLADLYREPGCPDLHIGYSSDGRISLRIEPLQLNEPIFEDHTIYLCTMESNTSLDLEAGEAAPLKIRLISGGELVSERLAEGHPLWRKLKKLAHTFEPVNRLPPGSGQSFKQIFAAPDIYAGSISAVILEWGDYTITVPYPASEVSIE